MRLGMDVGEKLIIIGVKTCIEVWKKEDYDKCYESLDFAQLIEDIENSKN